MFTEGFDTPRVGSSPHSRSECCSRIVLRTIYAAVDRTTPPELEDRAFRIFRSSILSLRGSWDTSQTMIWWTWICKNHEKLLWRLQTLNMSISAFRWSCELIFGGFQALMSTTKPHNMSLIRQLWVGQPTADGSDPFGFCFEMKLWPPILTNFPNFKKFRLLTEKSKSPRIFFVGKVYVSSLWENCLKLDRHPLRSPKTQFAKNIITFPEGPVRTYIMSETSSLNQWFWKHGSVWSYSNGW